MKHQAWLSSSTWSVIRAALRVLAASLIVPTAAQAVNIQVHTFDRNKPSTSAPTGPVAGFRYTIEEDCTYPVDPNNPQPPGTGNSLSLGFHRSYMPVVATGEVPSGNVLNWTPPATPRCAGPESGGHGRYFVSVMPLAAGQVDPQTAFTMNGTSFRDDATTVTVPVYSGAIPTAQISVFVHDDSNPINNQPDAPGGTSAAQERGLCGFEVQLFEAGGTYGASGGRVLFDTFGNPVGTVYGTTPNPDGSYPILSTGVGSAFTDANGVARIKNLSPAKYTIYVVPPRDMPSEAQCPGVWKRRASDPGAGRMAWELVGELPPASADGDNTKWHQTATIEGTWGIDAWVKSNEPTFFKEFGPPGHHVFIGFVRRFKSPSLDGAVTAKGRITSNHMSRPPGIRFSGGRVMDRCWIGVNEAGNADGAGRGVYANQCNDDGTFTLTGLRPNTRYSLAVWDEPLDNVFASYDFVTPASGELALGDVPVFSWFANYQGKVFYDANENGMLDAGERGIPSQVLNLRFRDGSIYQSVLTDDNGDYEFAELFPFFNWLVAEVDFTRFKATGATVVVDDGGPVDPTNPWSFGALSPQPQPENNGAPYRVELSTDPTATPVYNPILLEGMQTFLGQTNVIHWGKKDYAPGENGGITGIVHYAGTRAEWDPRFAVAENNEPGIPDVEVRLYRAGPDGRPAAPDGTPIRPRGANESAQEYQAYTKQFALRISAGTDNWDNSLPTGCVDPFPFKINAGVDPTTGVPIGGTPMVDPNGATCYDGMRIWNQVRPAVFDGGYAFFDYFPGGELNAGTTTQPVPIKPGRYVVEAIAPLGYEHQKEEDKNVDFGDLIAPGALAQPVECVGDRNDDPSIAQSVPLELAQFAGVAIPDRFRDTPTSKRPYCNKKLVVMGEGMNAAADFHMFTRVPVAGHIVGMILDDLANEFDPYSPNFGEKYAPPFMPVSIRDWTGREISRVYSDRYGTYNALVPSTFSYNIPLPSGVAPNIVTVCLNSPTMQVTDSAGVTKTVLDPHHNRQYSQFCYNFQYLPGKTTYLDTPVLPIAAFAGPSQFALDCENPATVPGIYAMTNGAAGPKSGTGPHVAMPASAGTADFTIYSEGKVSVPNPEYDQNNLGYIPPGKTAPAPKTIERDYGFGTATGKVTIGGIDVTASVVSWGDDAVSVKLSPATVTQIRREVFCPGIAAAAPCPAANNANRAAAATVLVTHANGNVTPRGVSLHIGGAAPTLVQEGQSIQAAVDAAAPGALITVGPGLYEENVIVDKRVRLQGFGAAGVVINAATQPTERLHYWRVLACQKVLANPAVLLPGQLVPDSQAACVTGDTADNAPLLFGTEESAGVFVLAAPVGAGNPVANLLQIDGLTISGSDGGGGIVVNGNAARIEISNNRVVSNQGIYGGGIRLGNPDLIANDTYVNARNNNALIHHNEIRQNGNTAGETNGGGGGISLYHGTHNYVVSNNQVCGNFSTGDGGGMAHFGRSNDGRIENNAFTFNQSFSQSKVVNGGGLAIAGVATPNNAAGISLGTGNVTIVNNLFQGNLAGAGDGGAISLYGVNGNDIRTANRFRVDVLNNVMVDNVAGLAGGGVALFDSPNVRIINNTIAHNDSTATAYPAFQLGTRDANGLTISAPQPGAGIAARAHSAALQAAVPAGAAFAQYRNFSNAMLQNNVVWHNRQFYWQIDQTLDQYACAYNNAGAGGAGNAQQCFGLKPNLAAGEPVVYADFGVIGGPAAPGNYRLSPMNSVLTNAADPYINANASNVQGDPVFMASYFNGPRNVVGALEQTTMQGMQTAAAFDEGQNFIDVRYGPLTLLVPSGANAGRPYGNYRATAAVAGVGLNFFSTIADLQKDAAGVPRDPTAAWAAGAFNAQ